MKLLKTAAPLCIAALLVGCSSTIHTTSKLGKADVLSLDAKQRVIVKHNNVVCAEPSPDAIVAQAAALSNNLNAPLANGTTVANKLAVSSSEAAASIAQRTQAIQLMRDGYYRICEGYMNGSIDEEEYKAVVKGIDKFLIALIGIEAIGGKQNVPAVAIGVKGVAKITNADGSVETTPILTADSIKPGGGSAPANKVQASEITAIVKEYFKVRGTSRRHSHHTHQKRFKNPRKKVSYRTYRRPRWQSYAERQKKHK